MGKTRKVYPSDVTEEEWWFVLPYLLLCREDAGQREHALRDVFDAVRYVARSGCAWRMIPGDLPPWAAVYQQFRRWLDAGVFEALVSDVQSIAREWAGRKGQQVTGRTVELAYVDQGYTGPNAADAAKQHGIRLEVVKHPMAKRVFVLLPRRWVVERSFAWAARFRRLARDYERLPQTLKGIHFIAFAILMTSRLIKLATS